MSMTATLASLDKTPTRGVRLNNPGNIRHSRDKWQGMTDDQPDKDFVQFTTPQFGIRAMVRILIGYEKKGYNTVRAIINRWAPSIENNTQAYISHVAQLLNVDQEDEIDVDSFEIMLPLVKAIIAHENKNYAYSDKLVTDAIRLAGVHDAPNPKLHEVGAFKAQAISTVATGATAVGLLAEPMKKAAEGLDPFQSSPLIQKIATVLVTVAGIATLIGMIGLWIKTKKGL